MPTVKNTVNTGPFDERFSLTQQERVPADRKAAGSLEYGDHCVPSGGMSGDFLAAVEGKECHADLVVLYQCLADDLTGAVFHQIPQLQLFALGNAFIHPCHSRLKIQIQYATKPGIILGKFAAKEVAGRRRQTSAEERGSSRRMISS